MCSFEKGSGGPFSACWVVWGSVVGVRFGWLVGGTRYGGGGGIRLGFDIFLTKGDLNNNIFT